MNAIALNKSICNVKNDHQLTQIIKLNGQQMNIVNCATAMQTIARNEWNCNIESLANLICKNIHSENVETRHISTILWSCAKLEYRNAKLIDAVLHRAQMLQPKFKPQEISLCIWGLGKLNSTSEIANTFIEKLLKQAEVAHMEPQGISNLLNGLANLQTQPSQRLLANLRITKHSFKTQELVNVIMSLAKLELPIEPAFVDSVTRISGSLTSRQVANVVWALVKSGKPMGGLQKLIPGGSFSNQEITMVVFAICADDSLSPGERENLLTELKVSWEQMTGSEMASLVKSIARGEISESHSLIQNLTKKVPILIPHFDVQDVEDLATAVTQNACNRLSLAVLRHVETYALEHFSNLSTRNIANIVWAFGKCGLTRTKLIERIESETPVENFNARDLSNLAWGVAMVSPTRFSKLMNALAVVASTKMSEFNAQECSKLLYAMDKCGIQNSELTKVTHATQTYTIQIGSNIVSVEYLAGGGRNLDPGQRESTGTTAATGGALWQDAITLANLLANREISEIPQLQQLMRRKYLKEWNSCASKRVVELGAGVGLVSIVAAMQGMRVISTDGDKHVLHILKSNIEKYKQGRSLKAKLLSWGHEDPRRKLHIDEDEKVDLILGAGLVYGRDIEVWKALNDTLVKLASKKTLILLAHGNGAAPGVHEMKGQFYEYALKTFDIIAIPISVSGCQIHALTKKRSQHSHKKTKTSSH